MVPPSQREPKHPFLQTLRRVPFFSQLDDGVLREIAEHCVSKHYDRGQFIFLEGESSPGLFVVHEGAVKIFKLSETGREQVLAVERAGRPVAELPAFDEGPYPASAMAIEETTLLLLPKDHFRTLFFAHPEIALGIVRSLSMRLRRMVELVEELAFKEVHQRLAHYLLEMAEKWGEPTPRGIRFELRSTNQEIAAHIGTVRELVSRSLGRFRDQGILSLKERTVTIHDVDRLRAEASASK